MNAFGEEYFENGVESGVSLYENYRWLPERTLPYCHWLIQHCGIQPNDRILDFGCAKGFYVLALRLMGYEAFGCDISEYAIGCATEDVRRYVVHTPSGFMLSQGQPWDFIHAKDVLEHIEEDEIDDVISNLEKIGRKMLVIVPVAGEDGAYVIPAMEDDATHKIRWTRVQWDKALGKHWESVSALSGPSGYPVGLKDNYLDHPDGFGFFLCGPVEAVPA